jgi:hypothetical protein
VGLVALGFSATAGDNWPQFRGPNGDGHALARQLPLTWSETNHVVWKTPIHDLGWSSPVVWDQQIWVTTATEDGQQQFAVCVDRDTGKVVHDLKVFDTEKPAHVASVNSYASPTPVIEAGRVYVHYGTYGTACLDTKTGAILWTRRDLNCDHHEGPGASPMLHGKMSETKNPPAVRTTSSASTRLKPPRIVFMASLCTPIDAFSILTPRA